TEGNGKGWSDLFNRVFHKSGIRNFAERICHFNRAIECVTDIRLKLWERHCSTSQDDACYCAAAMEFVLSNCPFKLLHGTLVRTKYRFLDIGCLSGARREVSFDIF